MSVSLSVSVSVSVSVSMSVSVSVNVSVRRLRQLTHLTMSSVRLEVSSAIDNSHVTLAHSEIKKQQEAMAAESSPLDMGGDRDQSHC